jgi:hypothetical protein
MYAYHDGRKYGNRDRVIGMVLTDAYRHRDHFEFHVGLIGYMYNTYTKVYFARTRKTKDGQKGTPDGWAQFRASFIARRASERSQPC